MTILHYETPELPLLLAFLYFINIGDAILAHLLNAGLVGSLVVGIIFGPQATNIIPEYALNTFIILGYIGLLLLVFEAGLSTDISLLYHNIVLSLVTALTGIVLPIVLSLLLLHFGYRYSLLQAFAAGAAPCSTSLGTTLALLRPELRQTRTGSVLMSAALLDDVVGLVIAAIIPNLATGEGGVPWQAIVRPILVSLAFAFGTPVVAHLLHLALRMLPARSIERVRVAQVQLFVVVTTLSGFVAGAKYVGTSELFGAYLTGALLSHIFSAVPSNETREEGRSSSLISPTAAFEFYLLPILQALLSPMFFATIGAALPIRSLISVDGSHRVVWRGLAYSLLMVIAKALVGFCMLVWPNPSKGHHERNDAHEPKLTDFGLAMVARGEIALIVVQLARPLLVDDPGKDNSEAFAVVIRAILVSTVGGAIGVGWLLRSWKD
ncbi:Cation/H+ exchanger [Crucibulum laeve]|uniref:Cation/H+ exchanger n=1 Tax=Crucibulum laeve TaxID=68775 RepID=A0A5C3LFN3_9AGAR|nr:Cation/H+ exchanger [Crucibulum laeve]